jgi:micrococcal nuclease
MNACTRIVGLLAVSAMVVLGAGSAGSEVPRRPIVYDVTVARLERYQNADLRLMTPATVTRHVDGDTFVVAVAEPPRGMRAAERVRLMGIDTPELGDPLAAEALAHVERRAGAGPVYLAFDFRRRDRYDRLLAFVYLPDGTLLNADLIEHGLATVYRRDDLMYFLAQFEDLEREARSRQLGVWLGRAGAGVIIVDIGNQSRDEHVLLRNDGSAAVDISGWRICDDDGDVLVIPSRVVLAPGETLAVGSGTGCVETHHPCRQVSKKNIWGNPGDVACLKDRSGNVVDAYAYGKQAADTCAS